MKSTVEPTPSSSSVSERSSTLRTSRAPTRAITSPGRRPACAAGVPGATEVRTTPRRFCVFAVAASPRAPSQGRGALARRRSTRSHALWMVATGTICVSPALLCETMPTTSPASFAATAPVHSGETLALATKRKGLPEGARLTSVRRPSL